MARVSAMLVLLPPPPRLRRFSRRKLELTPSWESVLTNHGAAVEERRDAGCIRCHARFLGFSTSKALPGLAWDRKVVWRRSLAPNTRVFDQVRTLALCDW